MNPTDTQFAHRLEAWYSQSGRDLPWRHTDDPYLIMLSEFILQQTQVQQGMAYYEAFVNRFPTVGDLAEASEQEVMRMWQGLGYYSRARHLHAAAKEIAALGAFPKDYATIRRLPGIGDYTAAAIMSFAYGAAYAVLDGNVFRVLARHFGISEPIDTSTGRKTFRCLADELLDQQQPALYNQAIMDFGATVCRPSAPLCLDCPLADSCIAMADKTTDKLPQKAKRNSIRNRFLTYIYMRSEDGQTLIRRRGKGDIWEGLYEFPLLESEAPLSLADVEARMPEGRLQKVAHDVRHQLTHQRLHADFYLLEVPARMPYAEGIWINESQLSEFGIPRLLELLLKRL